METKQFATADVMSALTGKLMGDIGDMCRMLNWVCGEPVFTHQLGRVMREVRPVVLAKHPHLAQAIEEAEQVNPENFREWRQTWEDRYGPTIALSRLTEDQHERIDPESELAEKVHPDQIITISTQGDV